MMFLGLPSTLFALLCVSIFVKIMFFSDMYNRRHSRVLGKTNKAIRKVKGILSSKKVESQFLRKMVISFRSFPKTARNS